MISVPVRTAIEEEGRLGKAGRVFDGAELDPEKRGIRKLFEKHCGVDPPY